jgi:hypothetical protein
MSFDGFLYRGSERFFSRLADGPVLSPGLSAAALLTQVERTIAGVSGMV